ncbi:metal ABC transporter permease [Limnobacter sp.]|uniref:metal ABC transporter permease n=1 Tax=Limnobacter sp. TaxID=2003368 RepID=UPI0035179731
MEYSFMRRALVAVFALAMAAAPLGCLLIVRRMSLVGDAMSHAMLPGAALGFLVAGLSLPAMSLGGFAAALLVALGAGFVTRNTEQREDTSFAALYLIALAAGVVMVSGGGTQIDLMHLLFGSVLAVDNAALIQIAGVSGATCILLAMFYRPILMDSLDPGFTRRMGRTGVFTHGLIIVLMVANLVSAFHALGTLMAIGLMMLPPAAARFWCKSLPATMGLAIAFAMLSGFAGLSLSYHYAVPSGPSIVLFAGALYGMSMAMGPNGSVRIAFGKPKFHTTG